MGGALEGAWVLIVSKVLGRVLGRVLDEGACEGV